MRYDIKEIKKKLNRYCKSHPEIECAYVFGSIAKQSVNSLSDIDIAVLVNLEKIKELTYHYGYKACLLTDLMKLFKTSRVDLVILNRAPILLKHRVLFSGRLVFSRNEKKRIAFQVETINKYIDMKYLRLAAVKAV